MTEHNHRPGDDQVSQNQQLQNTNTQQFQNPSQPFAAQQSPSPPQQYVPQTQTIYVHQEFDILGLLSIVFLMFFWPVGLILAIVGLVQAKKKHLPITLSLIGLILNILFAVLTVLYVFLVIFANIYGYTN